MIVKNTYSDPGVWRPGVGETEKKVAGPCEVSALKLAASGGAAAIAIYDAATSAQASPSNLKWFLDASTADVDSQVFVSPLVFQKGVYAIVEQGANLNPVLCISRIQL